MKTDERSSYISVEDIKKLKTSAQENSEFKLAEDCVGYTVYVAGR